MLLSKGCLLFEPITGRYQVPGPRFSFLKPGPWPPRVHTARGSRRLSYVTQHPLAEGQCWTRGLCVLSNAKLPYLYCGMCFTNHSFRLP
jgi:hypothetical protein